MSEYVLRKYKMSKETPGYRLLQLSIVRRLELGRKMDLEEILENINNTKGLIIPKAQFKTNRSDAEQWMIELIRSVGIEECSVEEFIERAANEILNT